MDKKFCNGSRFIWKNEKEMEWIIFVEELNVFIDGLQVSESDKKITVKENEQWIKVLFENMKMKMEWKMY